MPSFMTRGSLSFKTSFSTSQMFLSVYFVCATLTSTRIPRQISEVSALSLRGGYEGRGKAVMLLFPVFSSGWNPCALST